MKGLLKKQLRKNGIGLLAAGMIVSLAGCGSSADLKTMASMETAGIDNGMGPMEYGYAEATAEDVVKMEASALENTNISQVAAAERKLIKTVDINVETQNYDGLLTTIQSQVNELGGYIESMNTYNGSRYYNYNPTRNADMTIRIPKEKLDGFLNTVSDVSNVVRRSDTVEDVTLAYVDLESHRDALRTEQNRLLELLEKAESVEDIITIEQRLSDVRYQLESMESRLRTYDNQVDYSTVYLNIEEVEIYTPVEHETIGERISKGFMESLDNIGEGFVEFGIWFVVHLPYLVVWAVILALFIAVLLWLIKHSVKTPKKQKTNNITSQETMQKEPKEERK